MSELNIVADNDPHLWLEDVTGDQALAWVRGHNDEVSAELATDPAFEQLRASLREVLDAGDRIPYVRRRGSYLYNFWQDATHPRGLWRRTTLEQYRTANPDWHILIDVDALAETEGENWVWQGATVLRPDLTRCLIELSRGGADATVVREFDLEQLAFVPDGFELAEAKSFVSWIDRDRIYVGTDFGEGSLTNSGYPRIVKEWRRGTPLSAASRVYEGKPDDVVVYGYHDPTEGYERDFIHRATDFFHSTRYLRTQTDGLVELDVPDDAQVSVHREWLLIRTRSDWDVAGARYPAGALLAADLNAYLDGQRELHTLFEPDAHTSLEAYDWTRTYLLLSTLSDVQTRLRVLSPSDTGWQEESLREVPATGTATIMDTDPEHSEEYFVSVSGFTEPPTLLRGEVHGDMETLKRAPAFFDAAGIEVDQYFATSNDGTQIPYFVVGSGSTGPVLLTGYGGFEVPLTPSYSGMIGRGWLASGGTYVVANIRGGGEYGPSWHSQVTKENRYLVYEDFAAVAHDLSARGIASPGRLGIQGGSNGGLLMGVMLTRYPAMFDAIVSQVPLLDMRRYHRLLAGASWMAEYGDPDDESNWAYLREYSPYHNVRSGQTYPPTLFVTSTRDDRVHPGHARKMVASMRACGHDVRYYENIEGGHGAAADNAQLAFKWALVFRFLQRQLAGG